MTQWEPDLHIFLRHYYKLVHAFEMWSWPEKKSPIQSVTDWCKLSATNNCSGR